MTVTAQSAGPEPIQQVPLAAILTDAACQARVKIRPSVVRDYRRAMGDQISEGGLRFPPIVLFTDGQHFWLADAEWSQWSDSEIARYCQVSQSFVTRLRRRVSHAGHEMRRRKVKRGAQQARPRALPDFRAE